MKRKWHAPAAVLWAVLLLAGGCDLLQNGIVDGSDDDPYGLAGTWYRSTADGEYTEVQTLVIRTNGTFWTSMSNTRPGSSEMVIDGVYTATATSMTITFTKLNGEPVQDVVDAMLAMYEAQIEQMIQARIDSGMTREEAIAQIESEELGMTIEEYLAGKEAELDDMFVVPRTTSYSISGDTLTLTDPSGSGALIYFTRM